MSLRRVLVANRGEAALRIVRACNGLGIESVLAASEADRDSLPAREADRTVCIGPSRSVASYLDGDALLATALGTDCDAVHPGYGFLAENADFATACVAAGLVFVGPRPESVRAMGDKLNARRLATASGVPVLAGSPAVGDAASARAVAEDIGYPVLLKASAGGGGRGIRVVDHPDDMASAFQSASGEAQAAFGDGTMFVERFLATARHIEVQVFGDATGNVIHLGDRDCSLQRRYQKVVEEAGACFVPDDLRFAMRAAAVTLAEEIGYENAGTVEFVCDVEQRVFSFLEMNTRIQVEHPVTEEIAGLDLVQLQLRVAGGEPLDIQQAQVGLSGHAIECRITAEDPASGFRPSPGLIARWESPDGPGVRLDSHAHAGYHVPPFYDSLIGKLITWGADRDQALRRMRAALFDFRVEGIDTNLAFLGELMAHPDVAAGRIHTRWIEEESGLVPR